MKSAAPHLMRHRHWLAPVLGILVAAAAISWHVPAAGMCIVIALVLLLLWALRRLENEWARIAAHDAHLATTLRSIGEAVITTDPQGCIETMNPVAERLTGWTQEEARGHRLAEVLQLLDRNTREFVTTSFSRVFSAAATIRLPHHMILLCRDGVERIIASVGTPIRSESGGTTGLVLVVRDVTEQALSETALRASQQMFQRITENVDDLITMHDLEGRRVFQVQKNSAILSSPDAGPSAEPFAEILDEDRQRVSRVFNEVIASGTSRRVEYQMRKMDGTIAAIESVGTLLRDADGAPEKVLVVSRDITARRAAEEALLTTAHRVERQNAALADQARNPALRGEDLRVAFRTITEAAARTLATSRASIWLYDEGRTLIHCADLYESPQGRHSEGMELHGNAHPNYFAALGHGRVIAVADARNDPRTSEFKTSYLEPLGITSMLDAPIHSGGKMIGVICHEHTGSPREWMPDEQNFAASMADLVALSREVWQRRQVEHALSEARDNLECKVAERTSELSEANERLKELDRLKSEFLAMMSHELRTPLNSIIGFTGIIRQGLAGPVNDEQKKQLGMVQNSAKHLLSLINDLLDLSRIESGRMEIREDTFSAGDLVREVIHTLEPAAAQKKLNLVSEVNPPEADLHTDRKKVFQVLLNLTGNAVKFTETGSVRVRVHLDGVRANFEVIDTGIGIRSDQLANLFQAFRQVDGSARREYEGTGLGLYLCRKLLAMLGGSIGAESQFGAGSRFHFSLPRSLPPAAT
jgi:PAS domain S-box-containing protein